MYVSEKNKRETHNKQRSLLDVRQHCSPAGIKPATLRSHGECLNPPGYQNTHVLFNLDCINFVSLVKRAANDGGTEKMIEGHTQTHTHDVTHRHEQITHAWLSFICFTSHEAAAQTVTQDEGIFLRELSQCIWPCWHFTHWHQMEG